MKKLSVLLVITLTLVMSINVFAQKENKNSEIVIFLKETTISAKVVKIEEVRADYIATQLYKITRLPKNIEEKISGRATLETICYPGENQEIEILKIEAVNPAILFKGEKNFTGSLFRTNKGIFFDVGDNNAYQIITGLYQLQE